VEESEDKMISLQSLLLKAQPLHPKNSTRNKLLQLKGAKQAGLTSLYVRELHCRRALRQDIPVVPVDLRCVRRPSVDAVAVVEAIARNQSGCGAAPASVHSRGVKRSKVRRAGRGGVKAAVANERCPPNRGLACRILQCFDQLYPAMAR
jgi:hypothetical protein